jgi:DnaJ homolog subfamily C member 28
MSPFRRDAEGRPEVGPTWESLIDRQIREAREEGAFDDLPHHGRRLPLEDDSLAGDAALAHRMLRNAGIAPPWIEADKEVRAILARLDDVIDRGRAVSTPGRERDRRDVERIVDAANRAIARLNAEAPTYRQHRRPLDLAVELARLGVPGNEGA